MLIVITVSSYWNFQKKPYPVKPTTFIDSTPKKNV